MTTFLLVMQIALAVLITILVLLQKSSSIGLGVYSGSNESLFGAKGSAGFLAKFTMFIGLVFIINTIALSYFYAKNTNKSIIDGVKVESSVPQKNKLEVDNTSPLIPSVPQNPLAPNNQ